MDAGSARWRDHKQQEKALLHMFREGPDGLSAENYRTITDTSLAISTRDLKDLIEKDAMISTGEYLYTRYRFAEAPAVLSKLNVVIG